MPWGSEELPGAAINSVNRPPTSNLFISKSLAATKRSIFSVGGL